MPQLKFDAKELTDVQVSHVSLVKRGAIRVPFRILKSNDGADAMINLQNIFKSEPQVPMVAAVLVNKACDLTVAKARIQKAGFQTDKFDDTNEGVVIFPQAEDVADVVPGKGGAYIVKMDEMLSCIVTGVTKSFEPINFDSASFDEVLAQEGMRPGIHLSMDVLGATVSNILAKVEDRAAMVTDLSKALDEFKSHIVSMAQAVPESAFSIDFFKAADFVVTKAETPAVPVIEATPEQVVAAAVVEPGAETVAPVVAEAGASGDTGMAGVMGQMANLAKGINALTDLAKETSAKVDQQATQLDATAALAKSASDAASRIGNTVRGVADDDPAPIVTSKSEQEAWSKANPPLMDTAMGPIN